MKTKELYQKIRSVKLCLMAHPDNEPDSEFADRIDDLEEIEIKLISNESKEYIRDIFLGNIKIPKEVIEKSYLESKSKIDKWTSENES